MENTQEALVATWEEALPTPEKSSAQKKLLLLGGSVVVVIGFLLAGIFSHDFSWYIAILVIIAAVLAIISQNRQGNKSRTITITTLRVIFDKRSYLLADLRGFWLEFHNDTLVITFEPKKRVILPITCYYKNQEDQEATEILHSVLPEVEAPAPDFSDSLNEYFHF